jgi:branched-chain amino acid transport system permease protein
VFSLVVCLATWFLIEKTKLGAYLRAATENPTLVRAFGINVPLMITLTYGFGVGAGGARRRAGGADQSGAPADGRRFHHRRVRGGRHRRHGLDHGLDRHRLRARPDRRPDQVFYPEASNTVVFVIMAIVLLVKPAGLFGRAN